MLQLDKGAIVPFDGFFISPEEKEVISHIKKLATPIVNRVLNNMENHSQNNRFEGESDV
ncbi:hypothetical protein [Methanobrevibacter sp. DSM 116169]|uniref:hypothetical protein n=1 Tax=Methanobrevibacter sp. DSM 116169 TaxID=3242727 RepID=UPI0038FC2AC1